MRRILIALVFCLWPFVLYAQETMTPNLEIMLCEKPVTQLGEEQLREHSDLVGRINRQIREIVTRDSLAPLRLAFGDQPWEAYYLYYERGRVVKTLAMAYPYVTDELQGMIRDYMEKLMKNPSEQPWNKGIKERTEGVSRHLHGEIVDKGSYLKIKECPLAYVLYGFWMYADRVGGDEWAREYFDSLMKAYQRINIEPKTYSQVGAYIAMARLAGMAGEAEAQKRIENQFYQKYEDLADLEKMEKTMEGETRWKKFYEKRNEKYFPGQPWMFLDAPPEVWRYLLQEQFRDVTRRIVELMNRYPTGWLYQAPLFTRWTGDESIGVPSEMMGIVIPFLRHTSVNVEKLPETMKKVMRSSATGYGDLYYIESLILVLEAHGDLQWVDTRATERQVQE